MDTSALFHIICLYCEKGILELEVVLSIVIIDLFVNRAKHMSILL